jgi:hypothetical protein
MIINFWILSESWKLADAYFDESLYPERSAARDKTQRTISNNIAETFDERRDILR